MSLLPAEEPANVLVAMSGGVDSSVCAALLVDAGMDCMGVTMKLFSTEDLAPGASSDQGTPAAAGCSSCDANDASRTCCSLDDVEDAKAVCRRLGIPHHVFNFKARFGEEVVDRFCQAYLEGRTPNPCIDCNRYLKFAGLQQRRRELGADYVATGHYARRRLNNERGTWQLLRAADPAKDQSYVLFHVTQEDLAHMLFPLGDFAKDEIRILAQRHGLITADKPESQDICFVPDGNYADFIAHRIQEQGRACAAFEPGPILALDGTRLGTHCGLVHYTIGQRKGIGVAAAEPLYVYAKDPVRNELVVAPRTALLAHGVQVQDVNLIEGTLPAQPFHGQVKTHYRQQPVGATATMEADGSLSICFDEPQIRSAPGQAAVLYDGDVVVGGGTIVGVFQ